MSYLGTWSGMINRLQSAERWKKLLINLLNKISWRLTELLSKTQFKLKSISIHGYIFNLFFTKNYFLYASVAKLHVPYRTKVAKFFAGDENFVRRKIFSDENFDRRKNFFRWIILSKTKFPNIVRINKCLSIAWILG